MKKSKNKNKIKYLLSPLEYKLPNPRIDGFRKLKEVNANTVDIFGFSLKAFDYFLKNKELPKEFIKELIKIANKMIPLSLTNAVYIRRAFVVPDLKNPPGPWFRISSAQEVVSSVKELYDFAISQKYHQKTNAQISGFIHPAIGDKKFDKGKAINIAKIPYGGYAVISNNKIEIYAVFGMNEGVQSLVADYYTVETKNNKFFITEKKIPQKTQMLCPTRKTRGSIFDVPSEIQFEQILSDNEILEITRVLSELSLKYGPQRVEFAVDAGEALKFNEVADHWKKAADEVKAIQVRGKVLSINNIDDLDKLSQIEAKKLEAGKYIILVGKKIIIDRNYDILGSVAAWKDNLYVLYPGVAATQHAMRVLADKGHRAFLVGNQKFSEGDEVQITTARGKVRVTNLSKTESQKIVSLWDASLSEVKLCGGKADRLSKLKILGFQVPHGFVLTTIVFDEIIKKLGFNSPVVLKSFHKIKKVLENPPKEILTMIDNLLVDYRNSDKSFAVRSSATIEDNTQQSMAGMFATYLNVPANKLSKKSARVFRSTFAKKIADYLKINPDLVKKLKMAVAIQEMIHAKTAGVIFGAKIQTGNLDIVEIEANLDLGEGIVSGQAKEVEQYKFSRQDKRIIERKGPKILTTSEAKALFLLSERLRSEFNDVPQDIEWAIDKSGQIWVLQSRDLYIAR